MLEAHGLSLLLDNNVTPLRLATTMPRCSARQQRRHAWARTLGNDATPLGNDATLSNDATLGDNNATLGNNDMLGNNATLGVDTTLGGIAAKHCKDTLGDDI